MPRAILASQSTSRTVSTHAAVALHESGGTSTLDDLSEIAPLTLADAINGLAAAIFFVDASRRVVHANTCGRTMLAHGRPLRLSGMRLSADDPAAEQFLREALDVVCSGDATTAGRIALPLFGAPNEHHVAHLLPLAAGGDWRTPRHIAVAAIFVQKLTVRETVPFEAITRCFKLTPAELRVLHAIVEIGGVPEAASTLGLSETTVKTHLQRIFEKTGTKRQADLVKFVAAFMSPLAEPLQPIQCAGAGRQFAPAISVLRAPAPSRQQTSPVSRRFGQQSSYLD